MDSQPHAVADEHQRLALDLAPPIGTWRAWLLGRFPLPVLPTLGPLGFVLSFFLYRRTCRIPRGRHVTPLLSQLLLFASRPPIASLLWLLGVLLGIGRWCRLVTHAEP